jgi:hypothetical protein
MGITHATQSGVESKAAAYSPDAEDWDATHLGTNDHGHTAPADGGLIAPIAQACTATSGGLTTGIVQPAGFVSYVAVTSGNAAHIIVLPAPVPGTIVILDVGANGFELRSSDPETVAINGGTGEAAESAIAADCTVIAICLSATAWKAVFLDADGDIAKVEAAA